MALDVHGCHLILMCLDFACCLGAANALRAQETLKLVKVRVESVCDRSKRAGRSLDDEANLL